MVLRSILEIKVLETICIFLVCVVVMMVLFTYTVEIRRTGVVKVSELLVSTFQTAK